MKAARIVLADDHALVRAGLRALLERLDGVQVVGEAADGRELLEQVQALAPDLVVLDLTMPNLHGLQAIERLAASHPKLRLLVISGHTDEAHVAQAFRSGAHGYLPKDAIPKELALAVRALLGGESYRGESLAQQEGDEETAFPLERLTARQREVLQLLAEGRNVKEVAFALELSIKTVETHRAHIMSRLQIRDLPGLVRWAIRHGLVSSER